MNERMEDLMYRAGLTAQGCWDEMDDYDREAITKLAELIVRECCVIADEFEVYVNQGGLVDRIKQHFGVE